MPIFVLILHILHFFCSIFFIFMIDLHNSDSQYPCIRVNIKETNPLFFNFAPGIFFRHDKRQSYSFKEIIFLLFVIITILFLCSFPSSKPSHIPLLDIFQIYGLYFFDSLAKYHRMVSSPVSVIALQNLLSQAFIVHEALSTSVFQTSTRLDYESMLIAFNQFSSPKYESLPHSSKTSMVRCVTARAHSPAPISVLITFLSLRLDTMAKEMYRTKSLFWAYSLP